MCKAYAVSIYTLSEREAPEKVISVVQYMHVGGTTLDAHLRILKESILLDALDEHQLVVAVPGPV